MTYQFPLYVPVLGGLISLGLIALAVFLLRKRSSLVAVFVCGLLGMIGAGILTPALAVDRVVLDDEKLQQTTGFWFQPTVKGFTLKAVASVQIGSARDRKNREYEVWIVNYKNGATETIDPGDLWILHRSDLIRRLGEKGIPVR